MTCTPSSSMSNRVLTGGKGMPKALNSISNQPPPRPSSSRPLLTWSMVTAALASTAGWRKAMQKTRAPTRTLRVSAARAMSVETASKQGPLPSGEGLS